MPLNWVDSHHWLHVLRKDLDFPFSIASDLSISEVQKSSLCFRTEPPSLCTMNSIPLLYSSAAKFFIYWEEVFALQCHSWFSTRRTLPNWFPFLSLSRAANLYVLKNGLSQRFSSCPAPTYVAEEYVWLSSPKNHLPHPQRVLSSAYR